LVVFWHSKEAFTQLHKLIEREAGISEIEAQAKIMGRYPNGSPIKDDDKKNVINFTNDFDYKEMYSVGEEGNQKWQNDDGGMKCPLSAHVRKANPRTEGTNYRNKNKIVRRGMPYVETDQSKGLLFMSYQRNLESQFEELVTSMLHSPLSNNTPTGSDLLTGKAGVPRIIKVGEKEIAITPSHSLVTLLGGAYFFAPCISFFKNINRFPDIESPTAEIGDTSTAINVKNTNKIGAGIEANKVQFMAIDEYKNIMLAPTHFGKENIITEKIKIILGVDVLPSEIENASLPEEPSEQTA